MKLVFKNWSQFAEFMESLEMAVDQSNSFEFETGVGLLTVFWANAPVLPSASLALTEWFETL